MRPSKMIAVHFRKNGALRCSGKGRPAAFVNPETARDLWETGLAEWGSNKQTYLVFTRIEAQLPQAAESLRMGPKVMDAFLMGSPRHIDMVYAWA